MVQMLPTLKKAVYSVDQKCYGNFVPRLFSSTFRPDISSVLSDVNKKHSQKFLHMETHTKNMPWMKSIDSSKLKHAAVLIPLCQVDGHPSLLFTRRSNKLYSHRGQVSFPGGKSDHADVNLIGTALRETEEETGLDISGVDVWGQLPPVPGRNFDMAVTGVIADCGDIDITKLHYNHDEVEYMFTRTIESLCKEENVGYTYFKQQKPYSLPVFLGGHDRIWGLTAIVLHITLRIIAKDLYKYNLPSPPRGL